MITRTKTEKSSEISKSRDISSFAMFQQKEFVQSYQAPVSVQPLNKSKTVGWFIRMSELEACKWTAQESDFDEGSVLWNYKQTFGRPPKTSVEYGLNFVSPRVQILLKSPLMIEETGNMKQIIGTFDDEISKSKFEDDKVAADLAASKGQLYKRKYQVRTKYLINILTKDNKPAHEVPICLTLKGLNGSDLSEHLKKFEKEMNKCLSKALNSEIPINYNEKFHSTTVFTPSLIEDMRGGNNVDVCAIESFDVPSYSTQEEAIESLDALTVPDEDREKAWKFQDMYVDYINMHSKADAAKLGGQYGLAEDVEVLPASRETVPALPTGEDASL